MKEYSVEVGKKGVWSKKANFKTFKSLKETKDYAREQLALGHAVSIQATDRYGEYQEVAKMGEKHPSKHFPNYSYIGKLTPLKKQIKSYMKSTPSFGLSSKDILRGVMD